MTTRGEEWYSVWNANSATTEFNSQRSRIVDLGKVNFGDSVASSKNSNTLLSGSILYIKRLIRINNIPFLYNKKTYKAANGKIDKT